jgi:hypothetical protein
MAVSVGSRAQEQGRELLAYELVPRTVVVIDSR